MREVNQHPIFISPNESTAALGEVGAKTVERDNKPWDMESISNKIFFPVEGNDGSALAKDRNQGFVAHANLEIGHDLV
jgi:hypothetical protein